MGLFSFIGKVAGAALGFVPGGGIIKQAAGIAGHLLHAKSRPMSTTGLKYGVATAYSTPTLRAQPTYSQNLAYTQAALARASQGGFRVPASTLRASPVMPGGGVATSQGIMAPGGGAPPNQFGGSRRSSGGRKRKRKSSAARSSSRARSGSKRRKGGRRLKFGSPAWRKKYMKRR